MHCIPCITFGSFYALRVQLGIDDLFAQHLARLQSPEVLVVELRQALGSTLDCLTDETCGLLLPGNVLLAT